MKANNSMRSIFILSILISVAFLIGCRKIEGFEHHLQEAIVINKERKPLYSALTDNRSLLLSNQLLMSETLTLPIAKIFDLRALRFIDQGINIVKNDFVSIEDNKGFEHPLTPTNPITPTIENDARVILGGLSATSPMSFIAIASDSFDALTALTQLEQAIK